MECQDDNPDFEGNASVELGTLLLAYSFRGRTRTESIQIRFAS
jgi:hypothetical protein